MRPAGTEVAYEVFNLNVATPEGEMLTDIPEVRLNDNKDNVVVSNNDFTFIIDKNVPKTKHIKTASKSLIIVFPKI